MLILVHLTLFLLRGGGGQFLGLKLGFYTYCLSLQAHCLNGYFFLLQTKCLFSHFFRCQILTIFSFLGSLWHYDTDCTSFAKKVSKLFAYNPSKEICTFLVFLNSTSGYLKFCIFAMARWRPFQNCIFYYFWTFFANVFKIYNWILPQIFFVANFLFFFAGSKSRA